MRDGSGPDYVVTWVYDGWNKSQETKTVGSAVTSKNFMWGLDLSQSMEGAGGIGGLLAVIDGTGNASLFGYDGNWNVSEFVAADGGVVQAHYEYDAFGTVILSSGALASENCFRFSTKERDDESGLVYKHLAFGNGVHKCPGDFPARLELRIFLAELLARTQSFELAGEMQLSPPDGIRPARAAVGSGPSEVASRASHHRARQSVGPRS